MAFNTNARRTDAPSNERGFEEAAGFVNVTLQLPGQPVVKLPSMALQASKLPESLLTYLNADPANIEKLKQYLVLDYKQNVKVAKVLDFSKIT